MEQRRRAQADRRLAGYRNRAAHPARPDREPPAAHLREGRAQPTRVVFAEGEEDKTIRAALAWRNSGLGTPILIGREELIRETADGAGLKPAQDGLEIHNARLPEQPPLHRLLYRPLPAQRACCTATASAWSTRTATSSALHGGAGRRRRHGDRPDPQLSPPATRTSPRSSTRNQASASFGVTVVVTRKQTVFIADTTVNELPDHGDAGRHRDPDGGQGPRRMGLEPRVAFLSFSNFGNLPIGRAGGSATPWRCSTSGTSTSSMTARCRPTWRSTPT